MVTVPTSGETFAKLIENLRYAQEHSAMLSHLAGENQETKLKIGWLHVSENLKKMQRIVTDLATRRMQ